MTFLDNIIIFIFLIILSIILVMIMYKMMELKKMEKSKLIDEILMPGYIDPVKEHQSASLNESMTIIDPDAAASIIRKMILDDLSMEQEMQENSNVLTNRQKLAVFIYTIGARSPEIFNYFSKDELETIIYELKQLKPPNPEQQKAILQEFHDLMVNSIEAKEK